MVYSSPDRSTKFSRILILLAAVIALSAGCQAQPTGKVSRVTIDQSTRILDPLPAISPARLSPASTEPAIIAGLECWIPPDYYTPSSLQMFVAARDDRNTVVNITGQLDIRLVIPRPQGNTVVQSWPAVAVGSDSFVAGTGNWLKLGYHDFEPVLGQAYRIELTLNGSLNAVSGDIELLEPFDPTRS